MDVVRYRPILKSGAVIGYLWATGDEAGFWPRAGSAPGTAARPYWLRWLTTAHAEGLTPVEALASWNPAYAFPHGTPAIGAISELDRLDELAALAKGDPAPGLYGNFADAPVQHYQVIRANRYLGRLWASIDDQSADFLPSPDLPDNDPAVIAWPARLARCHAAGLSPIQALHALRDAPDISGSGELIDPLGQCYLGDLHR